MRECPECGRMTYEYDPYFKVNKCHHFFCRYREDIVEKLLVLSKQKEHDNG